MSSMMSPARSLEFGAALKRGWEPNKYRNPVASSVFKEFAEAVVQAWGQAGFPRVIVGRKRAAQFMLTDYGNVSRVGDSDIAIMLPKKMPWPAFVIEMRDSQIQHQGEPVQHLWVAPFENGLGLWVATEHSFLPPNGAMLVSQQDMEDLHTSVDCTASLMGVGHILKGVTLALSDRTTLEDAAHRGKSKRFRDITPRQCRNHILTEDVTDVTEAVPYILEGKDIYVRPEEEREGGIASEHTDRKLQVRYVRRGHVRNQAYGPGWSQHRTIWIDAVWVGPEDAPICVRAHRIPEPKAA